MPNKVAAPYQRSAFYVVDTVWISPSARTMSIQVTDLSKNSYQKELLSPAVPVSPPRALISGYAIICNISESVPTKPDYAKKTPHLPELRIVEEAFASKSRSEEQDHRVKKLAEETFPYWRDHSMTERPYY